MGAELVGEPSRRRRHGVEVAGLGAVHRVEGGGDVAHRARHDELGGVAVHLVGRQRDASARRLEADEPAPPRRQADGAAAVVGVGDRHEAGGHRGTRAAARAAGRVVELPRVVRRAEGERLRRRLWAELRHVGLPERDQAGRAEAGAKRGIGRRAMPGGMQGAAAAPERLAGLLHHQVLQQEGNAA